MMTCYILAVTSEIVHSVLFLQTASRGITFHLDVLGCQKGHKPDQVKDVTIMSRNC